MSHKGRQGRMSECSGAAVSGAVILEEPEAPGASGGRGEAQAQDQGPLRCAVWPRQQTWLCVVPLLIGFIGLGLSLMLLKWIVVGTVRDYVPTDLVGANNRIGQDPIFLSKPSGIPKSPDTTTTTTASTPTVVGGNPTQRAVTVTKERTRGATTTTTVNPRAGGASGSQVTLRNPGNHNGRGPPTTTAAPRTTFIVKGATSSSSPSNPTVLHDSTQMWTGEHTTTTEAVSTTLSARTHGHRKTPSPTVPPLHSEHFKPCHEKDLAYCLNGGECFVIETLSGPHKHCKCREGYQGIRCDQFLPKTDSILSDPNHLGIEFMESKEVYKRQVLSITSIAMAICLLGTLCMALYCRNKRRREKLQAHLKESRSLKNYTANSHNALDAKARLPNTSLQMHECCKRPSQPHKATVCQSSFAHCNMAATPSSGSRAAAKHHRSGSLSHSPEQRMRAAHWSAPRRTPPIPRGRLNPIGGSKFSGPAYQHLQEVDSVEKESEAQRSLQTAAEIRRHGAAPDAFIHMQTAAPVQTATPTPWSGRGPRRPGRRHGGSPPPPFRSCSIPIIPSVQSPGDEASCMQTSAAPAATPSGAAPRGDERRGKAARAPPFSASCSAAIGRRQDEVALLLEEAQEQLRALARRRPEEAGPAGGGARETVCFLNLQAGSGAAPSRSGPTQTQLLSPSLSHTDLGLSGQ
ncbi:pro-neuregulin-3, membrane-bound isoform [Salarias fasciatus]|uniref:pro-neuregulin-3, membrane-bound isoform n=1 Tax=Salarias fasciatus TaxID=181472 RepID=UPI00117669CD|nr:pro-neuregulin-3, membrane-bound isoform-like [Salarias fasciatus]